MATEIIYNGSVIATLEDGQRATLACSGKKMLTDLLVTDGTVQWARLVTSDGYTVTDNNELRITTMEG